MRFFLLLTLAGCFFLSSCNYNGAFNYSQAIVKMEESLGPYMQLTETKVAAFMESKKYDSIAVSSERMESMISNTIEQIKRLSQPEAKGVSEFRNACVNYFEFLKSIYTSYKEFGLEETDKGSDLVRKKWLEINVEKERVINEMQTAQEKFAKDNGFEIQPNK